MDTINIIIPPELQSGKFSNVAKIYSSNREILLDFSLLDPSNNQATLVSRVIITMEHAKEINQVLSNVLEQYEKVRTASVK